MVGAPVRTGLRLGLAFAACHSAIVPLLILLRVKYWSSFGSDLGRLQGHLDFFADGLVRGSLWALKSVAFWLARSLSTDIGSAVAVVEAALFVVYGGLVYFLVGFVVGYLWRRNALRREPRASQ